jgi:hypothetical protein
MSSPYKTPKVGDIWSRDVFDPNTFMEKREYLLLLECTNQGFVSFTVKSLSSGIVYEMYINNDTFRYES